jgi:hypothetical protein
MANPWFKKNPLMSMWLSAANAVAGRARGVASAKASDRLRLQNKPSNLGPAVSGFARILIRHILGARIMDKRKMHAEAARMLANLGIRMPSAKLKAENLSADRDRALPSAVP